MDNLDLSKVCDDKCVESSIKCNTETWSQMEFQLRPVRFKVGLVRVEFWLTVLPTDVKFLASCLNRA